MATDNSREARRKRILERGSDRLALITGRVDPVSPPSLDLPQAESQEVNDVPGNEFSRRLVNNESVRSASIPARNNLEPQLHAPDLGIRGESQPASIPPSSAVDEPAPLQRHLSATFTAKKIRSSITASKDTRILTSIAIALLVILSHLRIPLLSRNIITSIVAAMPVYLVLLTDVTIVIARILREEVNPKKTADTTQVAEGLGANLETGLLAYKAITAAFMDCSVYIVVVICGLCLVQGLI